VRSRFQLSRAAQTRRILAAMESLHVRILARPSGRLIGEREPYDVDMLQIVRKARKLGIALELNAHPSRQGLVDTHCRMAKEEEVRVAIRFDAHGTQDLDSLRFGIGQARRAWLEKADVLNTLALRPLRAQLARARGARL
jgi:DNA polymerase (family 10)